MEKLSWLFQFQSNDGVLDRTAKAIENLRGKMFKAQRDTKKGLFTPSYWSRFKKSIGPSLKVLGGVAKAGLALAAGGAAVAGTLAAVGAYFAIDASVFKEKTMAAFKTFTGSGEEASKLYAQVLKTADAFAVGPKDALDGVKQLLGAGFKMEEAMQVFAGATDLSKLTGGDTKGLTLVMGQILSKGKLQTEELLQLAESGGLAMGKVIAEIGKLKGIDTSSADGLAKIQKMLEGGQIDSKTGIAAALNAIKTMTGKNELGDYAKESAKSVGGLIERLKNMPQNFLLKMNADPAMKPLRDALEKIVTGFEVAGPRIMQIMSRFAEFGGRVFDAIANSDVGGVIDMMADGFDAVANGLERAWPYVKAMGSGIFAGIAKVVGPMFKALAGISGSGPDAKTLANYEKFGQILGWIAGALVWVATNLAGPFVTAFGVAAEVIGWFGTTLGSLYDSYIAPIIDSAWTWGSDLIGGLWQGIKDGFAGMLKSFEGLVDLLPATVKKILGIASPSKVFADLGSYSAEGFGVGFEGGAANMNAMVQNSIGTPDPGAVKAALGGGAAAGGGQVINVNMTNTIHTSGNSGAEEMKDAGGQIGDFFRIELGKVA